MAVVRSCSSDSGLASVRRNFSDAGAVGEDVDEVDRHRHDAEPAGEQDASGNRVAGGHLEREDGTHDTDAGAETIARFVQAASVVFAQVAEELSSQVTPGDGRHRRRGEREGG